MTGLSGALANLGYHVSDQTVGNGHRGDAASLLPEHMASTVENSAGQTQTDKINVAKQCAATRSPVLQCHVDPDCRGEATNSPARPPALPERIEEVTQLRE
jgi:hypothetical protein